jgi:hypothetical protein
MRYPFLSPAWFDKVDELIARAGDLQIPPEMKAVTLNVTITAPTGDTQLTIENGVLARGHKPGAPTQLALPSALARAIFVDGDTAAGVQAFLAGEMKADGDLSKLVAISTVEPSERQKALTREIAAITE